MARTLWRNVATLGFVLSLAACTGRGCTSCAIGAPVADGFPADQTVANAATARITRSGLDFLSTNLPTVVGNADGRHGRTVRHRHSAHRSGQHPSRELLGHLPNRSRSQRLSERTRIRRRRRRSVMPTLAFPMLGTHMMNLHLDAVTPNAVQVSGTVPLQLEDTPVTGNVNGCLLDFGLTLHIGYGTRGRQLVAANATPTVSPYDLPVTVTIPARLGNADSTPGLHEDRRHERDDRPIGNQVGSSSSLHRLRLVRDCLQHPHRQQLL